MIGPLAGNSRVQESINNLIKDSHLPHAIIIDGDEGTGRHTLSEFIATAAMCEGQHRPCGECRSCRLSVGHNHPDIQFVSPEEKKKALNAAQVRKIRSDSFVKPHYGGMKIFIIDKADFLSEISQNALLKIIEEPPQSIMFILICESANRLLDTVLSRCVTFTLYPPEQREALEYLLSTTDKKESEIISALSATHNNIGKALTLLGRRRSEKGAIAADFLNALLENEPPLSLLLRLKPLEKDRAKASEFISELKILTAEKIRENTANQPFLKSLLKIYDTVTEMEDVLSTNINLTLFFTTLVANIS